MKATELMIGDWVFIKDYPIRALPQKVRPEHFVRSLVEFEPIPLTPEILEKNWFKIEEEYDEIYDIHNYYATLNSVDSEKRNVEVNYRTFGNEITIFCNDRQNVLLCHSLKTQIKHVHELQHIFKILKIDKEIVL